MDPDQARSDLGQNRLQRLSADDKSRYYKAGKELKYRTQIRYSDKVIWNNIKKNTHYHDFIKWSVR